MTPLQIDILLHYHCSGRDYRDGDYSAPAVREAIDWMRAEAQLIENDNDDSRRCYKLSERGQVYVNALMAVPLPIQTWIMPGATPAQ